jgi:hypothetical protein
MFRKQRKYDETGTATPYNAACAGRRYANALYRNPASRRTGLVNLINQLVPFPDPHDASDEAIADRTFRLAFVECWGELARPVGE